MAENLCPLYQEIDGYRYPPLYPRENIEFALKYKPKNNDRILVTYPKCGTTWTQQIITLIINNGLLQKNDKEVISNSYIEVSGEVGINSLPNPRVIKTHLAHELLHYNKFAKYIFVLRNPKDQCVSYYHHIKGKPYKFNSDFHDFFNHWINGELHYGNYFEHTFNYWSHRFDNNFSFLVYEHMKYNPRDAVLKIGQFLGEEYVSKLTDNNGFILDKVLENSSIEIMKTTFKSHPFLVRKGIVGDWKSHFTKDESDLVDQKVKQWFSGTALENLWIEEMKW